MTNIKFSSNKKVGTLCKEFKEAFGSTLRVYNGRSLADENDTLSAIRKEGTNGGELTVKGNILVGNFEKKVLEMYGIKVQVATADNTKLAADDITIAAAGREEDSIAPSKPQKDTATPTADNKTPGKAAELYKNFKDAHDGLYTYYKRLVDLVKEEGLYDEESGMRGDWEINLEFELPIHTGDYYLNVWSFFIDDDYDFVISEAEGSEGEGCIDTEGEWILDLKEIKYYDTLDYVTDFLIEVLEKAGKNSLINSIEVDGKLYDKEIFEYSDELLEEKLATNNVISFENNPLVDKYPVQAVYVNECTYGFIEESKYDITTITKSPTSGRIEYRDRYDEKVFHELFSAQDKINLAFLLESID